MSDIRQQIEESLVAFGKDDLKAASIGLLNALGYLTACLNSRLLQYYFERRNPQMVGKTFAEIKVVYVERLPIHPIDFADKTEKAEHNAIVKLVEKITATKKDDPDADTDAWEREIDERVYRLYGLTKAEIAIVEGD